MNKTILITSALGISLLLGAALPALADDTSVNTSVSATANTGGNTGGSVTTGSAHTALFERLSTDASSTVRIAARAAARASTTQNHITNVQGRSDTEIDNRIASLNALSARLANMKLLPASALTTLEGELSTEISTLTTLKGQIGTDTSTTTVRADASSITKAYRIYMLVIPQAQIAGADDRIDAVVTQLGELATKFQTRITEAQNQGVDVSAAVSAMSNYSAKTADAKVQADAAVAETASLTPDNGDTTVMASNSTALKDARAKLQAAEADLKAARADAAIVVGVVKGYGAASATASGTSS